MKTITLFIMQFSPASSYFFSLKSTYLPKYPFHEQPRLVYLPLYKVQVSHPHKIKDKFTVLNVNYYALTKKAGRKKNLNGTVASILKI